MLKDGALSLIDALEEDVSMENLTSTDGRSSADEGEELGDALAIFICGEIWYSTLEYIEKFVPNG